MRGILGKSLSRHFPSAPKAPCRKRRRTLTEEPFFLLLGIPPNRNFKPPIFFPFPFFLPSLEPLIFFLTPGPGETEDLFGTLQTAVPQITPHPNPGIYRQDESALGTMGSRAAASTAHRARPLGQKAASADPALSKKSGKESICPWIQERDRTSRTTGQRIPNRDSGLCNMGRKEAATERQECCAEPTAQEGCTPAQLPALRRLFKTSRGTRN